MKPTKMFLGNQRLKDVYVGATKWEVFKFKFMKKFIRFAMVAIVLDVIGWSLVGGFYYAKANISPQTVYAEKKVEVPVKDFPPILTKICKAESGGKQFLSNGRVVRGKITPSDIGLCQINETIWNDKARELGYDIYTEQGNKDMAMYIFEHYGTDPWNSSKPMWK